MKHVILASVVFVACSSAPPPDPGVTGPTVTQNCAATDQNPYGVCYPNQNIGTGARTASISGNLVANYAFTGYKATDTTLIATGTPGTVHLSDYFDPQQQGIPGVIGGKPIKLIHVSVSGVWCIYCNYETDATSGANFSGTNTTGSSFANELAPLGVVFVQALDDSATPGIGASPADLNNWINNHKNNFTTVLDPGNQNLGVFFAAGALPFNMNIDARTMEILEADSNGFDSTLDQTIKSKFLPLVDCLSACKGAATCESSCK